MSANNSTKHAYLVGGGLASLSAAVYLLEDAGFKGENIHIIEALPILGGSNDGAGSKEKGFICRGGRMLNEETYENFWELTSRIPSLDVPNISVKDEILAFDHANPTKAKARLIDKNGNILPVTDMGFNTQDRMKFLKLFFADENDFITYYSDNPQRVNSRTVDLLGQPFLSLFNQDEQEAISQILRDLHQGAADHYEQWFPQNKQTIYNNFYAVRDEDGTFLGTLQFTGDITRIQGLRGIRTVFNAGKSDR